MLNMTNVNEHATANGVAKIHINGINASNDPSRLLDVLQTLELITPELATPLKTIAAHGGPLKDVFTISVYSLDQKLRETDAPLEARMAFKASLARFGMLVVPR
jgi:hypothetical protein